MKYFIVEGALKTHNEIDDNLMQTHMSYTKKAMDSGAILIAGLKSDKNGGVFIMKCDSLENLENYLSNEPFKISGIQEYKVTEFSPHYFNELPNEWFHNWSVRFKIISLMRT